MTPVTAEHRRRRGELGRWRPKEDRPDPVDLVEQAHSGRLERLVPVRVGRMVASPYAFLRGSAVPWPIAKQQLAVNLGLADR